MARQIDNPIWNAGYNAYFDGVERDDNPYLEDGDNRDTWEEGWDSADSDSDDD